MSVWGRALERSGGSAALHGHLFNAVGTPLAVRRQALVPQIERQVRGPGRGYGDNQPTARSAPARTQTELCHTSRVVPDVVVIFEELVDHQEIHLRCVKPRRGKDLYTRARIDLGCGRGMRCVCASRVVALPAVRPLKSPKSPSL